MLTSVVVCVTSVLECCRAEVVGDLERVDVVFGLMVTLGVGSM